MAPGPDQPPPTWPAGAPWDQAPTEPAGPSYVPPADPWNSPAYPTGDPFQQPPAAVDPYPAAPPYPTAPAYPGQPAYPTTPAYPAAPRYPPQSPYQSSPYAAQVPARTGSRGGTIAVLLILAVVLVAAAIGAFALFRLTSGPGSPVVTPSAVTQSTSAPTPPVTRTTVRPPTTTTAPRPSTTTAPTSTRAPSPGTYPRERETLTPAELAVYGGLHQGDCVTDPPDDLSLGVTPVPCSEPHTDQVMGFVDLSQGMPDIGDAVGFELAVAQRCNSLKATLSIPADFNHGVAAAYPDQGQWDDGIRAALCWVPIFHTTWTGSVLDGTAKVA